MKSSKLPSSSSKASSGTAAAAASLLTTEERAQQWLKSLWEQRALWLGLGVPLLLVLAGFWGWQQWSSYSKELRLSEIGLVHDQYDQLRREYSDQSEALDDQISDLEEQISGLQDSTEEKSAAGDGVSSSNSAGGGSAELSQLQRQLTGLQEQRANLPQPDFSGVISGYQNILSKFSAHAEGLAAGVIAAQLLTDEEKFLEATEILAQVVSSGADHLFYGGQVRWMYINLLEDTGQYDKALQEIVVWADTEDFLAEDYIYHFLVPSVLWAQVRLALKTGDREALSGGIEILVRDHSDAPETRWALLARLSDTQQTQGPEQDES